MMRDFIEKALKIGSEMDNSSINEIGLLFTYPHVIPKPFIFFVHAILVLCAIEVNLWTGSVRFVNESFKPVK